MTAKRLSTLVLTLALLASVSAKTYRPFRPQPIPPACPASDMACW